MVFNQGHALLIGVGSYANEPSWTVPATVEDARALAAVLGDPAFCGYPPGQITQLSNEQATRQGVLDALNKIVAEVGPESTVLLFYSGHGHYDANRVYYLTTHDLQTDGGGYVVPSTSLSQKDLLETLRAVKAKRVLLVFNACHAGEIEVLGDANTAELPHANLPDDTAAALLGTGEGRVILTACRSSQFSFIGNNSSLTVFAEALANGLRGKGVFGNAGYISIFDLYNYLYDAVGDAVADDTRVSPQTREHYGGTQEPQLTIIKQVGPFPVALYKGAQALGTFDPQQSSVEDGKALRTVGRAEAREKLVEQIQGGRDGIGGDSVGENKVEAKDVSGQVAGRDAVGGNVFEAGGNQENVGNTKTIEGDEINATGAQGFLNRPQGPVSQTFDNRRKEDNG